MNGMRVGETRECPECGQNWEQAERLNPNKAPF